MVMIDVCFDYGASSSLDGGRRTFSSIIYLRSERDSFCVPFRVRGPAACQSADNSTAKSQQQVNKTVHPVKVSGVDFSTVRGECHWGLFATAVVIGTKCELESRLVMVTTRRVF